MIRLIALWAVVLAGLILAIVLREEKLATKGRVPLGRLRRLWMKSERRCAPRFRVDFEIRYQRLEGEHLAQARTRDLSQTGVGIVLDERLSPGSFLYLEFLIPGVAEPLAVTGKVAWSRQVPSDPAAPTAKRLFFAGLQFHQMDREKEARLAQVLQAKRETKG